MDMAQELGALTLLGESADWLKDAEGRSIREHRLEVVETFRTAWSHPEDDARLEILRSQLNGLFDALRHNHLYPDGVILSRSDEPIPRFIPADDSLRKDFEMLRNFCVVNKFGIGEVHILYLTYLLSRMLHLPKKAQYDAVLENNVGDALFLRVPIYRADNLGAFSYEAKARFHAVRIMRSMEKLGLLHDGPVGELSVQDQAEARELLTDGLRAAATRHVQRKHRLAFHVLDKATALEEFARAHAAGRAPTDERSPDELFLRLRHWIRKIPDDRNTDEARKQRLNNLGVAGMVRAMAHVEPTLAKDVYGFLRSSRYKATVRHGRMFDLLPNSAERLRFLNCLYVQGKQNPVYYLDHFQRYFPGEKLRFVHKDVGFALEPAGSAE
jgi:hypothetical protein